MLFNIKINVFRMFPAYSTSCDTFMFYTPSFQLVFFPNFAVTKFQNEQNISFLLLRSVHVWLGNGNSKLQGKVADHQLNNTNFVLLSC